MSLDHAETVAMVLGLLVFVFGGSLLQMRMQRKDRAKAMDKHNEVFRFRPADDGYYPDEAQVVLTEINRLQTEAGKALIAWVQGAKDHRYNRINDDKLTKLKANMDRADRDYVQAAKLAKRLGGKTYRRELKKRQKPQPQFA